MPWSSSSSSTTSKRLRVPRFSLNSIWSSDSRSSGSSADFVEPTTPTTPGREDAIETTPRPPLTIETDTTSWTGGKNAKSRSESLPTSASETIDTVNFISSPETMETAESWNVETPKGDRNSKGSGGELNTATLHGFTPGTAFFQPGQEFARKMGSHSDSLGAQPSHTPESDLQVVLDDSPTVPGSTRPFVPTHSVSTSGEWQTQKASAVLHSVVLNGPVNLSDKQRGKLPVCDGMSEDSYATHEEMHAELVEGITIANAYSSPSYLRRTSSLLTSSSSSSGDHSHTRPLIPNRKSSRLEARIQPRTSSRAHPAGRPAFPFRSSSLAVDLIDPPPLLSDISSLRATGSTASSTGGVQLAPQIEQSYLKQHHRKPVPTLAIRHPPPTAPPKGLPPPPPGHTPSISTPHVSHDSVQSVLSLLDTLQEQSARPRPIRAATSTTLPPPSHLALRRVHSQPEFVRHYDQDDSMQIPFKFRIKRSGSARLAADTTKSVHPMDGMSGSQGQRFDSSQASQTLTFSQKLSARWGGSKRFMSGRAKAPVSRPGLSALPEGWLNQPEQPQNAHTGGFYVDQLESPEAHQPTFSRPSLRDTFAPAVPDSPTLSGLSSLPRDSISNHENAQAHLSPPNAASRPTNRPMSIMSNNSLEAHASEWASDVLLNLEEARAALREAESWLWPSPPPRTPAVPSLDGGMSTSVSASTLGGPVTPPVSQTNSFDPAFGSTGSDRGHTWSRTRARTSRVIFDTLEPSALRREQGFGMVQKYQYVQSNMDGTPGVVVEGTRRVTRSRDVARR